VTVRLDAAPSMPLSVGVQCGSNCSANLTISALNTLPVGEWRNVGIPLKCFAAGGADMRKIDMPFALTGRDSAAFSLASVSLGTAADTVESCAR